MNFFIKKLNRIIEFFLIIFMICLTCSVTWQVISRYILNSPSTITEELARFLMIWTCLLGAAYTVGAKKHLSIDLLMSYLSNEKKIKLFLLISFIISLFSIIITIGGCILTYNVFISKQTSPTLMIPMGYVYLIMPISGIVIFIYSLTETINHFQQLKRG